MLLTFVALAVVGRMKLEGRADERDALFELFVFVLAAEDAGDILLRLFWLLSLKLELDVDAIFDGVGGFFIAGPILDPLELLRLAGTLETVFVCLDAGDGCSKSGLFDVLALAVDVDGFVGIFLTVFVDTALFNDDLELLKLARELLLSTSNRLFAMDEITGFGI